MKFWPVPNSYSKKLPKEGHAGSFWEDRGDRFHCGVDIYAPYKSKVVSIDNGIVIEIGIFTSSKDVEYWNETKFIIIKNQDNYFYKYAELDDIFLKKGDPVKAGQEIASVGLVLDKKKINKNSPEYIKKLRLNNYSSMLHLEVLSVLRRNSKNYLGGNWFGKKKPKNFVDPKLKV
jgi:hypothetical protein